jgi:hypothetical protein
MVKVNLLYRFTVRQFQSTVKATGGASSQLTGVDDRISVKPEGVTLP